MAAEVTKAAAVTLPRAILEARQARHGVGLAAWEEAIAAGVQSQLELAVLRLSQQAPGLLDPDGPKFAQIAVELLLPEGERLRFTASLEVVEG